MYVLLLMVFHVFITYHKHCCNLGSTIASKDGETWKQSCSDSTIMSKWSWREANRRRGRFLWKHTLRRSHWTWICIHVAFNYINFLSQCVELIISVSCFLLFNSSLYFVHNYHDFRKCIQISNEWRYRAAEAFCKISIFVSYSKFKVNGLNARIPWHIPTKIIAANSTAYMNSE